jgi:DNA polymerase-3 subunit epsilon
MNNLSFTAIDFETAQGPRWSICQIGIVRVENNVVIERYSILVPPPPNKYSHANMEVHGINPDMTQQAKTFPEIWSKIKHYIENQTVVAHNASFDADALIKTLEYYNLDIPFFEVECTFKRLGKSLNILCKENNIPLNHHDGLSDAEACAALYLKFHNIEQASPKTPKRKRSVTHSFPSKISGDVLKPDLENIENCDNPFYMKKVVVSGTYNEWPDRKDLAILLKGYGADIDTSVTGKTNILCAGSGVGPKKLEKMRMNLAAGKDAVILSETEIIEILVEVESCKES